MSKKSPSPTLCSCGSSLPASDCCLPLVNGLALPATAEALMRSRYCAYVLQRSDYLQSTWHASTRPEPDNDNDGPGIKWLELIVHEHCSDGTSARVSFTARFKVSGRMGRMHENSRFVHENGRWWYLDGEIDNQDGKTQ